MLLNSVWCICLPATIPHRSCGTGGQGKMDALVPWSAGGIMLSKLWKTRCAIWRSAVATEQAMTPSFRPMALGAGNPRNRK